MRKYIVTERGYEYNDEYNVLNEDGYTVASKLFSTKEDAKNIGIREAVLKQFMVHDYETKESVFDSSSFDFKQFGYEEDSTYRLEKYFTKKGYEFDKKDYQLSLPEGLTEEEVLEAWKYYDVGLFNIIEVEEYE